jgi:ATP-dependent Clp protease ATP-binding subunit ClpA
MAARREAEQRKNPYYTAVHMFYALMRQPPQSVIDLIRAAGGDPHKISEETEKIFAGMG